MDHVQKFLMRADAKLRTRIITVVEKITEGNLDGLDVKKLQGTLNLYRCRVEDVRIIFARMEDGSNIIVDADFRGNIYKK